MMKCVNSHRDLRVWQTAMDLAMRVFELSRGFPGDERYSMTDQMRRSSRSVAANITEAWRKRRYEAAFVSKLSDTEAEAAETQTWVEMAKRCQYLPPEDAAQLDEAYEVLISQLVTMMKNPSKWTFVPKEPRVGVREGVKAGE